MISHVIFQAHDGVSTRVVWVFVLTWVPFVSHLWMWDTAISYRRHRAIAVPSILFHHVRPGMVRKKTGVTGDCPKVYASDFTWLVHRGMDELAWRCLKLHFSISMFSGHEMCHEPQVLGCWKGRKHVVSPGKSNQVSQANDADESSALRKGVSGGWEPLGWTWHL